MDNMVDTLIARYHVFHGSPIYMGMVITSKNRWGVCPAHA